MRPSSSSPNGICLRNPEQVYHALTYDEQIHQWFERISNHYAAPQSLIHLFYPCTSIKPFSQSQTYQQLSKTLEPLKQLRHNVHVLTVSEPFGIIPQELEREVPLYDCPGLFRWWCAKHGEPFDAKFLDRSVDIISLHVVRFLRKIQSGSRVAFVRTYSSSLREKDDHTHRRILEKASEISGEHIELLPTREMVQAIVKERGRYAWDRYGIRHPIAQIFLLEKLKEILNVV